MYLVLQLINLLFAESSSEMFSVAVMKGNRGGGGKVGVCQITQELG